MRSTIVASVVLTVVAAVLTPAAAQSVVDYAPPADLKAPPDDAQRLPSGLVTKAMSAGKGTARPSATDIVTVNYTGWSTDGQVLDSTVSKGQPAMFPLNKTMAGWRECAQLMTLGEKRRCWIPEALAYRGQAGRTKGAVVFDIELLDTRQSPTIPPSDVKAPPSDAIRTVSGLSYKVLRPGVGVRKPSSWDKVTVHYTGWTTDGRMFDSSISRGLPQTLALSDVIRGWAEGLGLMVEGERVMFWIPQDLAYKGDAGAPRGMLVFDVDLLKIE